MSEEKGQDVLAALRPAGTTDGLTVNGIRFEWRVPTAEQYLRVLNEHAFDDPIRQDIAIFAFMMTAPKELAAMKHPKVLPRKGKSGRAENETLIQFLCDGDPMLFAQALFPAMKRSLGALRDFDIPDEDLKRFFPAAFSLRSNLKLAVARREAGGPSEAESGTAEGLGSDSESLVEDGESGPGDEGGGKESP